MEGGGSRDRVSIAILALGGQGGGVLADWIQAVARSEGWWSQATSVPGVAQRTGSTVYYVEMVRRTGDRVPIMAQMPVPGDVDIVIASELMEAGRGLLRGFVTQDRTTLIGSTHRIYAISEKSAMGDGRADSEAVLAAALKGARRFIGFDMEAATDQSGSVISSVMFGALAGSGATPFARDRFEAAILASGIAVASNLRGFEEGFNAAQREPALPIQPQLDSPTPTTEAGRRLLQRITDHLPEAAQLNATHGVKRLMDYQDAAYAVLYLDRLAPIARLDRAPFLLTSELARHLALWMSYEDIPRVADLKTRQSRFERVAGEVRAADGQILGVTEFMHPRLQEICEILPVAIGRALLASPAWTGFLQRFFTQGRHVETTRLRWFLLVFGLARLRRWRRASLRFETEQRRIGDWLARVEQAASVDQEVALALIKCQRLIKGYGDTFERGWHSFEQIMAASADLPLSPETAGHLRAWTDQALSDDRGFVLGGEAAMAERSHGKPLTR